ncbi:guanylate kinase [Alicyclobacillus mengziensis]|uniref:Guanylate kinase n=1 Tax=Alicyclobacillus mengziensis TaxID=2931921 RepID=A0A9X7W364_9BACL|nr:guanylate kinase [Alicyclobacillus mengziensis]QSO49500.1 guanylate kinase [Alicyclobacillus mengziensis]
MSQEQGILFVLSGPSGAGKGTVCKALMGRLPEMRLSISATTRQPREGEQHGVNYFFKTKNQFQTMIESGQLLEWAEVYGNYYGTPRTFVEEKLAEGSDVLLEIDIQGAMQVKETYPDGVFLFLIPPSAMELEARILGRGTETEDSFATRFGAARDELQMMSKYDYVVVNDVVEAACERIESIITAEHCSVARNLYLLKEW